MPVSLRSLGFDSLKELATDLNVPFTRLAKDELLVSLETVFAERGFADNDISTALSAKPSGSAKLVESSAPFLPIQLNSPTAFNTMEENRVARWENWMRQFEVYTQALGLTDEYRKSSILLHCAGPDLQNIVSTLTSTPSLPCNSLMEVITKHFKPADTMRFDRFQLHETKQRIHESTADFITRLRLQAKHCKFICPSCTYSLDNDRLLDVLIRNTSNHRLRQLIFEKGIDKLEEASALARSIENAITHTTKVENNIPDINLLKSKPNISGNNSKYNLPSLLCKFCKNQHVMRKEMCPAYGKKCPTCHRLNHFSVCCPEKKNPYSSKSKIGAKNRSFTTTEAEQCGDYIKTLHPTDDFTYALTSKNQAFCFLEINGVLRKFLIDTGSSRDIIPKSFLPEDIVLQAASNIRCYDGSVMKPLGQVPLDVKLPEGKVAKINFLVVEKGEPLLGLQSSLSFECLQLNPETVFAFSTKHAVIPELSALLYEFHQIFGTDLGSINGVSAKIQLKADAKPSFHRHRPVPLALRHKVSTTLDEMVSRGTLTPIRTSEWASPMVTVPKADGSVRLCADYTNSVASKIDVEAYPLPHPDELLSSLSGNKVFTKLDLRNCYEQFQIDDNAKEILTVNTIKGLMRYERLPYGISSAPAIVQRAMEEIFQGLDVHIYLDDLLLATPNMASHISLLRKVFRRLHRVGARLRKDKCELCVNQVNYLGFIITSDGKKPNPDKVQAVTKVPPPNNVSELRSFLGLVRFYDKFIPELATIAYPLHQLLKKSSHWSWTSAEQSAFNKLKTVLSTSTTLVHYDPNLPLVLSCDASPYGLGAILSHRLSDGNERPISYASRTLSPAEKNYAHIDKEALSIIYGVSKYEKYLLGRKFILVSDHKPLQAIFGFQKGLPSTVTARLHRYSIRLSAFNFSVEYRSGDNNSNVDALSRAPVDQAQGFSDETDSYLVSCLTSIPLTDSSVSDESNNDTVLQTVLANVRGGWAESRPTDPCLVPYWKRRRELSVSGDIIIVGRRVVLPRSLQPAMLNELHKTHQGMEKMKSLARLHVWWPSIDEDIQDLVARCDDCQRCAASPSLPWEPWPAAESWKRVHLDYGCFEGQDFLILVDAGSKWIEANLMRSTTTSATLRMLFTWFSRLGFPKYLHTDGGPQFTSAEFEDQMKAWKITHSISPPYHPQSNGLAERGVRLIKEALKKNNCSIQKLEGILFRYRCTPLTCGKTPSELLFGFNLRSQLNMENLEKKKPHSPNIYKYIKGEPVWLRDYRQGTSKWQKGTVIELKGRSVVRASLENGASVTRHLNQVRKRRT